MRTRNSCSTVSHIHTRPSTPIEDSSVTRSCHSVFCIYLNNILVTGESEVAHLQNLAAVLKWLESAGVCLKREKCSFMISEVEYLGHSISAKGIQPVSEKVTAIRDAPQPQNVSQLCLFLGMLNYYGKFLPKLETLL